MLNMFKYLITAILITILLIVAIQPAEQAPATPVISPIAPVDAEVLTHQVNNFRTMHNLSVLSEEPSLCAYAEQRADQIKSEWNHDQFWADKCSKTNFALCGENLAKNYSTEEQILTGWKNSPTHMENLKKTWSSMCIRCVDGYCAQEFGI